MQQTDSNDPTGVVRAQARATTPAQRRWRQWLFGSTLFRLLMGCALFVVLGWWACYWFALPVRMLQADSTEIWYQDGSPLYITLSPDEHWRLKAMPSEVDPKYLQALIAYEDKRFYSHLGVDPIAIGRAALQNLAAGRVVSGASTLTMQVVRILEPRPRCWSSKIIEAARAIQLEARLSKQEILSAYLRFVPFGKNIEGVRAGAFAYFGHDAKALSPLEIATLVAVPQDPNHRYPGAADLPQMRSIVLHVARRLRDIGVFSQSDWQQVQEDPLPTKLRAFPRQARHAALWLHNKVPNQRTIHTTLDLAIQAKATRLMNQYRHDLANQGIHNGSLVAIENESGQVRALVGNFDYWDEKHHGQVTGFVGPRSPGSTLKPFLFALSIDRGLLLPSFLLQDVPVRFRGYEPKNYDEKYRGLIRADEALAFSLNIPAVNQLRQIGLSSFLTFLESQAISTLRDHQRYGLSVAIGGLELCLLELTNLYSTLARGGTFRPWQVRADAPEQRWQGLRSLSPGAAYLTRQALRTRDRPDFPSRRRTVRAAGDYFWKTGTSYGHKDAWAIGANDQYTVGVWLGNFDGSPAKPLVGGERAGPILFDMLDALTNRQLAQLQSDPPPNDLIEIEVCALSGKIPSPDCSDRRTTLALKSNLPAAACDLHKKIEVDRNSGYALCPLCRRDQQPQEKVYTVLPTSVRRWVRDQTMLTQSPPRHLPTCPHVHDGKPLRISQPQGGAVVYLLDGIPPDRQEIPLEVEGAQHAPEVYWFVNGTLLARAKPDRRVWLLPKVGKHTIRAVDTAGRGDEITIQIKGL